MHGPVDGGRGGYGVGEDAFPLREDQVGRDAQRPAFGPFGDEDEESLGLLGTMGLLSVPHHAQRNHPPQPPRPPGLSQLPASLGHGVAPPARLVAPSLFIQRKGVRGQGEVKLAQHLGFQLPPADGSLGPVDAAEALIPSCQPDARHNHNARPDLAPLRLPRPTL